MSVKSNLQLLQQIPIFAAVDPANLQAMIFSAQKMHFDAGEKVICENERGAAAYLVISGSGDVLHDGSSIGRVERGALIGELSMIADVAYSVTVRARGRMEVLNLSQQLFMRICNEFPATGEQVLSVLAKKLDTSLSGLSEVKSHFEQARSFREM